MLRKALEMIRRAGLRAYHGSNEPDIEELAAYKPNLQHGGDIGAGVYVSENYDTAAAYGKYVYVLDLDLNQEDIFDLSAENQSSVEGYEGESVLIGEFIPPFYFFVGKNKYLVSSTDYDIGAAVRAKQMLIEALESSSLDVLVPLVHKHDGLPSLDDLKWDLTDMEWNLDESQIEAAENALLDQAAPLVDAAEAWLAANEAIILDLEDIGAEVEAAGYKALYFERGGTIGDEILVFDPANVRIVEKVTKEASLGKTTDFEERISAMRVESQAVCPMCEEPILGAALASEAGPICEKCAESGLFVPCDNCGKLILESKAESREVYPQTFVREKDYTPAHWEDAEYATECDECQENRAKRRRGRAKLRVSGDAAPGNGNFQAGTKEKIND